MSDAGNAAAAAAGDEKLLPEGGAADTGIADTSLAGLADDGAAGAATWPEDWRERLAGDDAAALRTLKRYAGVDGLWKKLLNQEKLISQGGHKAGQALPEDATPEEVAAYRKAAGLPETPEGYALAFPDSAKTSDADKETLTGFQQFMHERHVPPAGVKAAFEWYSQRLGQLQEARTAAAQDAKIEALVELRKEYPGGELKRNLAIADEFLEAHGLGDLLDATLPNGRPVRLDAGSLKSIIAAARSYADEESLIGGDTGGGGKSIDDEKNALVATGATRKLTKAEDARLDQLFETIVARDEKRGKKNAASAAAL